VHKQDSTAVRRAKAVISGEAIDPAEGLLLVKELKTENQFRWGHRVLAKASRRQIGDPLLRLRIAQERALCTYKDPDRPVLKALNRALDILASGDDLAATTDQETLGLAGAIHRRLWQATGQRQHLERALRYYDRGYRIDPIAKEGYTSINAAFILDQLADIERAEAAPSAETRRYGARVIRETLATRLPPLLNSSPDLATNWWYLVTVAETFFGLANYTEAAKWLQKAKALPEIPDWEFRSTAVQLATLHQLQQSASPTAPDPAGSEAARVLKEFLGSDAALTSAFVGKIGLALSGGGFRASLFHIGVLARLAELDLLRHVEVLSCVSGGSIIGAHYYLQLREVLETTDLESLADDAIRDIYIGTVQRVARDFLAGVQRNIRMRVFANPFPMLRTLLDKSYSRTIRLGELFEEELFARVFADATPERRRARGQFPLSALTIIPRDRPQGFDPKHHNWRRKAKVPVLVLNATTLNTGHNWQYTARYMGESPYAIDPDIDGTNRLRRVYYPDAPRPHRQGSLGQAVVASACVPGLFEPVRIDGLYERHLSGQPAEPFVLRQVDGGVHDNQGIASLLEQDCGVLLVSDASGQTTTATDPGGGIMAPLLRSNAVLMQRVRQELFARLKARLDGNLLKGMMFIHLKQDLDIEPVDWLGCEEPPEEDDPGEVREPRTSFGIRKQIQELLAGIRTDLDSFSDVEAYALMTSGYRMAVRFLPALTILPARPALAVDWAFLGIEDVMTETNVTDASYRRLAALLETGGNLLWKAWRQSRMLVWIGRAIILALLVGLIALLAVIAWTMPPVVPIRRWVVIAAIVAALAVVGVLATSKARQHAGRIGIGLFGLVAWLPVRLYLWKINRRFLDQGKLEHLA
jgi:predicted acylesterase/phospholipase RssA